MPFLQGKKIILGITGSIAAYKTPQLVRLLVKSGADVQVVLTKEAGDFVSPLSLSTVSKNPVISALQESGQWHNHVLLAHSADLLLIAPCTANSLAKMALGLCDNMLAAIYLSAKCPIIIAPAMDEDMWLHSATQANVESLKAIGHTFIPVGTGDLASGLSGEGRMALPEEILSFITDDFFASFDSVGKGKKALVTAGPTFESIDPVRFIGNHSSGKMGTALAIALANKGFEVDLVTGPAVLPPNHRLIKVHPVVSALDMFEACKRLFKKAAITIMAAAVSDYRPEQVALQKIKKEQHQENFDLKLVRNPDILKHLGQIKEATQILVGFALETENEEENARKKGKAKNADFMVLNSLNDKGAGFATDTNKVTIIKANGEKIQLPLQSKQKIAEAIIFEILR